eukprot:13785675-Alexandrium_andersonii.AAC.1
MVRRLPSVALIGFGSSFSCRFLLFTGPSGPWKDSVGRSGHAAPPFAAPESRRGHRAGQPKGRADYIAVRDYSRYRAGAATYRGAHWSKFARPRLRQTRHLLH